MKTISEYVDAYAKARNLTSDYQVAKDLSLTRSAVSRYRNNKGAFDIDVAWRIADACGIDPAEVIAACEIQRAQLAHDSTRAKIWTHRLGQISAAVVLLFAGFFHAGDASAAHSPAAEGQSNVYYVKSLSWLTERLRRLFRSLHHGSAVRQYQPAF